MSATGNQPNLGSGVRWLAAVSSKLVLLILAACGSTALPYAELGSSRDGQGIDGGVIGNTAGASGPGRPVTEPTPVAPPRAAAADSGPATGGRGAIRDGGVAMDGGVMAFDAGPQPTDAGVTPQPLCRDGVQQGSLTILDKRRLAMLRGCKRIDGDVLIAGDTIDDLSDLSELTTVDGYLQIGFAADSFNPLSRVLTSLKGLDSLRSVGRLMLIGLTGVTSLEPLAQLESASLILLTRMDGLTNLNGLGKARWNDLQLNANAQLSSLDGLSAPEIANSIQLAHSPLLASVQSLRALKTLSQGLSLTELKSLKSLDGLQALKPGYQDLTIDGCHALTELTTLGAYGRVNTIVNNQELRGLGVGPSDAVQSIMIGGNPKLENLAGIGFGPQMESSLILESLPSLKSLADLNALREVGQLMIARCDGLKDLTGLGALTTLQFLQIEDCAGLVNLTGLDSLARIESELMLESLVSLSSLSGAPKLQHVGSMRIAGASSLTSLQGLDMLTQLSDVFISSNVALTSLRGLDKVTEMNSLILENNAVLPNLMGLASLQVLSQLSLNGNASLKNLQGIGLRSSENLSIENNPLLADLSGLENFAGVANSFSLVQNASLISLRALANMKHAGELLVYENRRLPECEVKWLAQRLNVSAPEAQNGPVPGTCAP